MKSKSSCGGGLGPDGETVSAVPAVVTSPCERRRNQENTVKMAAAAALGRKPAPLVPSAAPSSLIADRASFLYRLLDFGQNKKSPPSKTAVSPAPEPAAEMETNAPPPRPPSDKGSGAEIPKADAPRSGDPAAVSDEAGREKEQAINGTPEERNDKEEVKKAKEEDTPKEEEKERKRVVRKASQKLSRKDSRRDSRKEAASSKPSVENGVSDGVTSSGISCAQRGAGDSVGGRDVNGRGDAGGAVGTRGRRSSGVARSSSIYSAGTRGSAGTDEGSKSQGKVGSKGKDEGCKGVQEQPRSPPPLEAKRSAPRDSPSRRVSFKVRGGTAAGRRSKMVESRVVLSSNTVAALTTKFNAIINENHASKAVLKIPQAKKQGEIKVIVSRKNSSAVKKEVAAAVKKEVAAVANGRAAPAKKQQQQQQPLQQATAVAEDIKGAAVALKDPKRKINISYRPSLLGTRSGSVKAAIQIFEQNASQGPPPQPQSRSRAGSGGGKPESAARPAKGESPSKGEHPPLKRVAGAVGGKVKPEGSKSRSGKTGAAREIWLEAKTSTEENKLREEPEVPNNEESQNRDAEKSEKTKMDAENEAKSRVEISENESESPDATKSASVAEKLTKNSSSLFAVCAASKLQSGKLSNDAKKTVGTTPKKVESTKEETDVEEVDKEEPQSENFENGLKETDGQISKKLESTEADANAKKGDQSTEIELLSEEVSCQHQSEKFENNMKNNDATVQNRIVSMNNLKNMAATNAVKGQPGRLGNYLKKVNSVNRGVSARKLADVEESTDTADCEPTLESIDTTGKETMKVENNDEEVERLIEMAEITEAGTDGADAAGDKGGAISADEGSRALAEAASCQSPGEGAAAGRPGGTTHDSDAEADAFRTLVDNMKPNNSFLWRSKDAPAGPPPLPPKKPVLASLAALQRPRVPPTPPPKPAGLSAARDEARASSAEQEDIYDDIHPASSACYSEDAYDDVGVMAFGEASAAEPPSVAPPPPPPDDAEDGYEYCGEPPPYDDCEGGGYQLIAAPPAAEEEGIYDDVKSLRTAPDETTSISNCYESIYNGSGAAVGGAGSGRRPPHRCNGSSASSSSGSRRSANMSSYDQTNSLYGIGGSRCGSASVSQASTDSGQYSGSERLKIVPRVSGEEAAHEVWSYQLTPLGQPRSETSDEWMDVEPSDSEHDYSAGGPPRAIVLVQERARARKSPSWSRKVRNQWSKSHSENNSDIYVSSSSILYFGDINTKYLKNQGSVPLLEHLGFVTLRAITHIGEKHEVQEVNLFLGREGSDSEDHNYETLDDLTGQNNADDHVYEDTDSFDSDDSDSNTYMKTPLQDEVGNRQLPDPPSGQNIYGISKIAEAAGKKMMEIGRSLRRIRSRHSVATERNGSSLNTNGAAATTSKQQASQHYGVPLPPPPMEKVQSTGNLSNRKTWTLRKFKRSNSSTSASPPTSTFYLSSSVDVDGPPVENQSSADSRRHSASPALECETSGTPAPSNGTSSTNGTCTPPQGNGSAYAVGSSAKRPTALAGARRASGSVRPNSPPPLPPPQALSDIARKVNKKEKKASNTSWYTECGLFDRPNGHTNSDVAKSPTKLDKPINNSWYAAVGLWDNVPGSPGESSLSEHDTSQTTDVSDSSAGHEDGGRMQTCFPDEPLYQFYMGTIAELAQRGANNEFDSDGYEEIGNRVPKLPARPSAMELIQPKEGQHRTLWCEIPEVVNSQVLSTLNPHQKKLQEAKFEIITSEASYMNSLNVLEHHFMSSPELNDDSILSKNERRILFGNVIPVKRCSEKFLADLEKCWQDNILLHGICDTIYHHATNYFNVYVKYCSNQIHLDRTLRKLKLQQGKFAEVLTQLEASPKCQLLSLHSFLMLPMQRITRLPLLIDAVLTRLNSKDDEYQSCELALATLNKVVQDCNEGARHMERMEQILILSQQLDFPKDVKPVPIISSSRYLVRSGELVQLVWRGDDAKLTFGKKFSKVQLYVFLFSDLLVITKRKSEDCYTVVDHCPRNLVQITTAEGMSHLPVKFSADGGRNLMLLTMLQNHEKKTVEMILSCPLESDRQRWLEAVSQPISENPDERVYEEWDCPQVMAIHPYLGSQPDELSLDVSDVVNVLRKVSDGWYQGERIRDGERGWFPGNYTVEIASAHVRARNLKQRYRLLALSSNFLESQRKEKQSK